MHYFHNFFFLSGRETRDIYIYPALIGLWLKFNNREHKQSENDKQAVIEVMKVP